MPTIQKVTFFFKGSQHGWTESYWLNSGSGLHADSVRKCQDLFDDRANLLGIECSGHAFRISTESTGPDALLEYYSAVPIFVKNQQGVLGVHQSDEPDVALLMRCNNALLTAHKHIFLRGIWDEVDVSHGRYNPEVEGWKGRINKFMIRLVKDQWGWVGVTGKTAKIPLLGYTRGVDDRVTITFTAPLFTAPQVGKRNVVRISGVNGGAAINGAQVVDVISTTSCTTAKPLGVGAYRHGGFGVVNTLGFIQIATVQDQKIVERKVGAPLLQSHGRGKAKARA